MSDMKFLEFYARYWDEMEAFYLEDSLEIIPPSGISELQIKNDIAVVGDRACAEAADLLLVCKDEVILYFQANFRTDHSQRRSTIEDKWEFEFSVWKNRRPGSTKMSIGVNIRRFDSSVYMVPWIFCRGGRIGSAIATELLGDKVWRSDRELRWESGTIALRPQPLLESESNQIISKENLIKGVLGSFSSVKPDVYINLFDRIRGL